MYFDRSDLAFAVGLLLSVAGLVVALAILLPAILAPLDPRPAYKVACEEEGGHIYAPGSVWFCLTEDGRMVEVHLP